MYKSRDVQKAIWKAHKVMGMMYKSRDVQKIIWKAHKVIGVMSISIECRKSYGTLTNFCSLGFSMIHSRVHKSRDT